LEGQYAQLKSDRLERDLKVWVRQQTIRMLDALGIGGDDGLTVWQQI
jgi:hypothetical protein